MEHATTTFFISQTQYDWLATSLPEPSHTTGRPSIPNNELLSGILFVLKTGCRWQDIPSSICAHYYSSCWRRFRFWQKHRYLKLSWQHVLVLLDQEGQLDLSLGNLDGSLVQSPRCRLRQPAPPVWYQYLPPDREEWAAAHQHDI